MMPQFAGPDISVKRYSALARIPEDLRTLFQADVSRIAINNAVVLTD